MNKRPNVLLIKRRSNRTLRSHLFLWVFLFWFLPAAATQADISEKVSQDVERFKAFEIQSELSKQGGRGTFVTIGADASCDFDSAVDSIQGAIDSGATEIRVASNGTYQNNLSIVNQSVVIRGGFADCVAADANQQVFNDLTVIDGSALAAPVIFITGADEVQQIRLENLVLGEGTSVPGKFGGGLSVDMAQVELQLLRILIADNSGSTGAGMSIAAEPGDVTSVTGINVMVFGNESDSNGGGLYCRNDVDIIMGGMSVFANNIARRGGGMYLSGSCAVSMYSEFLDDSMVLIAGLYSNTSTSNGGGAYVTINSDLYLFGQRMCEDSVCLGSNQVPIVVQDNEAGTNMALDGNGGGIFLDQSSFFNTLYANGLYMSGNSTRENGGGVYISDGGEALIERQLGGCWNKDRCNLIIANQSGTNVGLGGAFYVADDGELNISQSYLEENRADFGTAISASGENALVTLEGVVLDDNGDEGNDGFSDFSVIRADLGATVAIRHSTVVDNSVQNSIFDVGVALDSSMVLLNSIVHDPSSGNLFGPVSGPLTISCLMAHEGSSFSGNQVVIDDPEFIDRMGGNFHLNPISPAIDMCQGVPMINPLDIDAELRGWDDPESNNGLGVYDAGADESYVNDVIFKNGFEA